MATGIPPRRAKMSQAPGPLNVNTLGLALQYEGKRDPADILQTRRAEWYPAWSTASETSDTSDTRATPRNRLFFGDNLPILAALLQDKTVRGQVRLIYIDPPYATGGVFQSRSGQNAYDDLLTGAHYVEFLRERLILLRELLAEDGSIYVHLDKNMAYAIKLVMDEVFGPKNFRSGITRKKCNPKNYTSKNYGNVADFILFYTKSETYVWNRPFEEWADARARKEYPCVDDHGRRFKKVPVHAPGVRHGETGQPWRGTLPPPGKHWQYLPSTLDRMDAAGEIYWSPTGNPRRKVYFEESAGIPVQDIWLDFRDAHNQNIKITGFPTEKNPDLLQRIIEASSNADDLVLDCFGGSGTTFAVASQLQRRWIGIDNSELALATTLRRFASGLQPMGDFVTMQAEGTLALDRDRAVSTEGHHMPDHFVLFADKETLLPKIEEKTSLLGVANLLFSSMEEKGIRAVG